MADPRIPDDQIDDSTAPLDDRDHRRLSRVDRSLKRGLALRDWWQEKTRAWTHEYDGDRIRKHVQSGAHENCFTLLRSLPHWGKNDLNYGFFDKAPVDAADVSRPVMGMFNQSLFDDPRLQLHVRDSEEALEQWSAGLRAFANRYLIRLTSLQRIAPYVETQRRQMARWLRPFSWWPQGRDTRKGFGFSQYYYKKRDSGRVGKFHRADYGAIDLRELEDTYEWVVAGVRIHDVFLRYPGGPDYMRLPLEDELFSVLSRELLLDDPEGDEDVRCRHGFGYVFLEDPREEGDLRPWRRPQYGVQLNHFLVLNDGRILGRVVMVSEKMPRLLEINVGMWSLEIADRMALGFLKPALRTGVGLAQRATPGFLHQFLEPVEQMTRGIPVGRAVDPLSSLARFANKVSAGAAARNLGVSEEVLQRSLLVDFARSSAVTMSDVRSVWRAVPDWADERNLPSWAWS